MPVTKRNGSEAKFYPNTSTTLESALMSAKRQNDNMGAGTILSQATVDRLNAIEPLYKQRRAEVARKKAAYLQLTNQKEEARTALLLHTSHFLQVFNMGVKRGKYSFANRALFGLPIAHEMMPRLKSESDLKYAAEQVVSGEAKRIAQGKEPMSNPSGAEVQAVLSTFVNLFGLVSNANDAYGDAQKALRTLHKEARAVVKRVWREVENYYNTGDRPRMRKLAREWGVHYARKGAEKKVTGTVTDAATGRPLAAVKLKFENGNNKTLTNAEGRFTLITNLMHQQTLTATLSGYPTAEVLIELKEGEVNSCEVKMGV